MSVARAAGAVAAAGLAWGLVESQWVERRTVAVPVPGLPRALDGLRILHLSDFHLGTPSLNVRAVRTAVEWGAGQLPDLVVVTGDLVSTPRGEAALLDLLPRVQARHGTFAVLGNHDVAVTRDPFSGARELEDLAAAGAVLLRDESARLDVRGTEVQIVGTEPRAFMERRARPAELAHPGAGLRILLCHFPDVVDRIPPGAFQLVLAGHLHGGQICLPAPGGKIRFAHVAPPYPEGVFELGETTLVVSRGLGTTFVPFRFFARPEATLLVLRPDACSARVIPTIPS